MLILCVLVSHQIVGKVCTCYLSVCSIFLPHYYYYYFITTTTTITITISTTTTTITITISTTTTTTTSCHSVSESLK